MHCGELRCYEDPRDHECALYLNLGGCEVRPSPRGRPLPDHAGSITVVCVALCVRVQVRRTISDSGCFAFELRAKDAVSQAVLRTEFAAEDYSTRERWVRNHHQGKRTSCRRFKLT